MTSYLSNVWKVVHFSYIFHIKLDIHKITFQAIFSIIFYKNSYTYAKNIEKLENGVNFLKNWVEVPVFDPRYDVTYPTLKQLWLMGISPDAHAQKRLKYAPRVILGWRIQIWTQFSDISNISPQAWRHHYQIGSKGAQSYISWNKKAVSMKICIHSNFRVGQGSYYLESQGEKYHFNTWSGKVRESQGIRIFLSKSRGMSGNLFFNTYPIFLIAIFLNFFVDNLSAFFAIWDQ